MLSRQMTTAICTALLLCVTTTAQAAELLLLSKDNLPIEGAAVWLQPLNNAAAPIKSVDAPPAVMDQRNKQFVPHVLTVQRGTEVEFPNSDKVKHHVYSFSEAQPFEIKLYSGESAPPVTFNNDGIVVLGCNIHDHMLAYLVVVDTPWHGMTDAEGTFRVSAPPGQYRVKVWHPRMHLEDQHAQHDMVFSESQPELIQLRRPLAPSVSTDDTDEFDEY